MPLTGASRADRRAGRGIRFAPRSLPAAAILAILVRAVAATAQTGPCVELRVAPAADPLPAARAAVVETLCGGAVDSAHLSARICPDRRPIPAAELAAAVAEAHEHLLADRFAEAAALVEPLVTALVDGCRPLSGHPDRWTPPDGPAAVHDAAAVLLWVSRETGESEIVDRAVRPVAAAFPGGGPSEALFPPSLRAAYAALRPTARPAVVAVAPTGCELAVDGRVVAGGAFSARPSIGVSFRCDDEEAWRVELAADSARLETLARPWDATGDPSVAETVARLALRWEAAGTIVLVAPDGTVVVARGPGDRIAVLRPDEPSRWAALLAELDASPDAPARDDEGLDAAATGALLGSFLGAGLLLAAGGGWALCDADAADALADRAPTHAEHDRIAAKGDDLTAAGWALVGVGTAIAVGAAVWLAVELAGDERPDDRTAAGLHPWLGPGAAGLRVVF
jgi:hypothetical protein